MPEPFRPPLCPVGHLPLMGRAIAYGLPAHPTHLASLGTLPFQVREMRRRYGFPPPERGRWSEGPEGVKIAICDCLAFKGEGKSLRQKLRRTEGGNVERESSRLFVMPFGACQC